MNKQFSEIPKVPGIRKPEIPNPLEGLRALEAARLRKNALAKQTPDMQQKKTESDNLLAAAREKARKQFGL
jgi:hypothetical protein